MLYGPRGKFVVRPTFRVYRISAQIRYPWAEVRVVVERGIYLARVNTRRDPCVNIGNYIIY